MFVTFFYKEMPNLSLKLTNLPKPNKRNLKCVFHTLTKRRTKCKRNCRCDNNFLGP